MNSTKSDSSGGILQKKQNKHLSKDSYADSGFTTETCSSIGVVTLSTIQVCVRAPKCVFVQNAHLDVFSPLPFSGAGKLSALFL